MFGEKSECPVLQCTCMYAKKAAPKTSFLCCFSNTIINLCKNRCCEKEPLSGLLRNYVFELVKQKETVRYTTGGRGHKESSFYVRGIACTPILLRLLLLKKHNCSLSFHATYGSWGGGRSAVLAAHHKYKLHETKRSLLRQTCSMSVQMEVT